MNVKGSACRKKGKKCGKTGILGAVVVFCVFGYFAEASRKTENTREKCRKKCKAPGNDYTVYFPTKQAAQHKNRS